MHAAVLKYFREIARHGSVRRAAATLNVAPSAVDRQLLKLEDELGMPVFDRLPGRMRLTLAGELLLRHVNGTLAEFDRIRAEIDDLRGVKTGHVAIGAVDSLLVQFLPQALDRFRADFPAVTYTVLAVEPARIPGDVAAGRSDIGFTFVSQLPAGTQFIATISAPIGVVMGTRHPLARKRTVRFEEALAFPVLGQQGPLPKSADIDPDFAAFRDSLEPRLTSNSIHMLKHAIRESWGIAFFTRFGFLGEIADAELAWRPFASRRINTLKLGIVVPTARALPFAALALADRLADELRALERSK
ncbi:MAG: LysR family transcriptional regulator [Telmatospirillum sp.]|nr:LysR family transcriptional regulator [Telmatospirillum sp.]